MKIEAVLDRVSNDPVVWQAVHERYEARVFCGVFLNNPEKLGEMFDLPATLVRRVAALGLDITFDVWPPTRDEASAADMSR